MDQNLDKAYNIKDAVPSELFFKLWEDNLNPYNNGWTLSNNSYKGAQYSWTRATHKLDPDVVDGVANCLREQIEDHTGHTLKFERINVNGQTTAQIADIHRDYPDPDHITAILFCCPSWNAQWGGSFMVYDENVSEYKLFPYLPNNAVVIPSQWDHFGESPNNFTHNMRVTMAFMFKIVS